MAWLWIVSGIVIVLFLIAWGIGTWLDHNQRHYPPPSDLKIKKELW
jgi:hypothetical protein